MPVTVASSAKPKMSISLREATSAPVTAKTAIPNQSKVAITRSNMKPPATRGYGRIVAHLATMYAGAATRGGAIRTPEPQPDDRDDQERATHAFAAIPLWRIRRHRAGDHTGARRQPDIPDQFAHRVG